MELKLTVLLFVAALLSCGSCLDWMGGGGNFTQDNLTTLRAKINAFDLTADYSTYTAFVHTLSTYLNTLWVPAWNVVIVYYVDGKNHDSVLYGYGFNGHWFWLNGIKTVSGKYVSFIIWKEYNCFRWIALDAAIIDYVASSFSVSDTNSITLPIKTYFTGESVSDVWVVAQDIQDKVPTGSSSIFQGKLAFTVIATQPQGAFFFVKVCAKDYLFINGPPSFIAASFSSLILMRSAAIEICLIIHYTKCILHRSIEFIAQEKCEGWRWRINRHQNDVQGSSSHPSNEVMIVNSPIIIKDHYQE